ncbi:MAG: response regulator [Acidimicrobiales bacterium]|nr:response regulator [Acidimicrobiales bacterium]
MNSQTLTVLVVEDNDLDYERIRRVAQRIDLHSELVRAVDGRDALDKLRGDGPDDPIERPDVVLLDLKTPRMNGFEFLQELRADEDFRATPVVVLTSSDAPRDIERAQALDIDGYLLKPIQRDGLLGSLQIVSEGPDER